MRSKKKMSKSATPKIPIELVSNAEPVYFVSKRAVKRYLKTGAGSTLNIDKLIEELKQTQHE